MLNFLHFGRENAQFEREMEERAENYGFTADEVNELLCQGVKPWDDNAWVSFVLPTCYQIISDTDFFFRRMFWLL